jgi:hypothetical protein
MRISDGVALFENDISRIGVPDGATAQSRPLRHGAAVGIEDGFCCDRFAPGP